MLRPLTVGEILDATFSLYRRRFGLLFGIALLTQSPALAIQLYLQLTGRNMLTAFGPWMFSMVLMWVGWLLAAGATLKAVSEIYLDRDIGIGDALGFARGKVGALLVAGFAYSLLAGLASLLLVVPGIIVMCGYSVVNQVVVLEQPDKALDSLGRSWNLTREHRMRAFGLFMALYMIILVPQMGAGFAAAFSASLQGIILTIATLLQVVLTPVMLVGFTLFYYDLRIRKEAFDLELLGSQLTAASA